MIELTIEHVDGLLVVPRTAVERQVMAGERDRLVAALGRDHAARSRESERLRREAAALEADPVDRLTCSSWRFMAMLRPVAPWRNALDDARVSEMYRYLLR